VTQGSQNPRSFTPSSLQRLVSASNPESGTVSYTFDANGNALTRTDARGLITTLTYDPLNRPLTKTYSDNTTPNVSYCYDAAPPSDQSCPSTAQNGFRGRLTQAKSSISTTQYTSFDDLGRIKQSKQITGSTPYPFTYGYDIGGNLTSMTLPTNRQINYTYDDQSRLGSVISIVNGVPQTVASTFGYAPYGAMTQMTMGNQLVEQRGYNPRFEMTSMSVGGLLSLGYAYGNPGDNGNLIAQATVAGGHQNIQSYSYDGVNRLFMAVEAVGVTASQSGTCPSGVTWCEQYGYDQFGNRTVNSYNGVTEPVVTPNASTTFPNNRISTANYDAAGNEIGALGVPGTFSYDAENRQTKVTLNAAFLGISESYTYAYDGDGRRISRSLTPYNMTSTYVYDAGGTLAAEYRNGNLWKEFIYGAGRVLMVQDTVQGTSFVTTDALGSTRLVTNSTGGVISRHDYLPFGKEVPVTLGSRNTITGYANPQSSAQPADERVLQRFTGQEVDPETELQYFQARYYSGSQGRFMSPDQYLGSMNLAFPQSLNRYTYVHNRPLIFIDRNGLDCVYVDEENNAIGVLIGDCRDDNDNGYFVDGTIDQTSFKYDLANQALDFSLVGGAWDTDGVPTFSGGGGSISQLEFSGTLNVFNVSSPLGLFVSYNDQLTRASGQVPSGNRLAAPALPAPKQILTQGQIWSDCASAVNVGMNQIGIGDGDKDVHLGNMETYRQGSGSLEQKASPRTVEPVPALKLTHPHAVDHISFVLSYGTALASCIANANAMNHP